MIIPFLPFNIIVSAHLTTRFHAGLLLFIRAVCGLRAGTL